MSDWWQYQAKKLLPKKTAAPKIMPFKPREEPERVEPMGVEESTASDTATGIHRIINKYWTRK